MNSITKSVRNKLASKGLRVTPQRMSILEAIIELANHPSVEQIIELIREEHPNIATGTVYKVLDTLVDSNLITRVHTTKDVMRYDGDIENHHHLYCSTCDVIEDYYDEELDMILKDYFKTKKFSGFIVEEVILQIKGTFIKCEGE